MMMATCWVLDNHLAFQALTNAALCGSTGGDASSRGLFQPASLTFA